jgi:hypothetical protein
MTAAPADPPMKSPKSKPVRAPAETAADPALWAAQQLAFESMRHWRALAQKRGALLRVRGKQLEYCQAWIRRELAQKADLADSYD